MNTQNLLSSVANVSDDTEFYTPIPAGYKPGKTKYVGVFGTVMSGLGKGIFASSLAKVLKDKGLTVAPIKLEGYLNLDSGTLNPFRHGEVFVLDDGIECDMDLGTYERMLDQNMSRLNFSTSGQIFTTVLEKERRGGYLGRDVQMIPHVTGEVKSKLRQLAVASDADVIFIEIGGTVGDVENAYYIEALRQLAFEEGEHSTCWVALTYIMEPPALGEQKSKAAQLGIKKLIECGIQPQIIACRAIHPVTTKAREKISLYSSVPVERVFSMHDCESIYLIPEMIRDAKLDGQIVDILRLGDRTHPEMEITAREIWRDYLARLTAGGPPLTIGVAGKYTSVRDSYASVIKALEHCGTKAGVRVIIDWIEVTDITSANVAERMSKLHGLIVPGGFGARGVEGKIACIQYARHSGLPFLGLCLGFQLAVIEFARNACGMVGANSTEFDLECKHPVIDILPEQKQIEGLGGNMRLGGQDVILRPGTLAARLYNNTPETRLRFRHRYEVDPRYIAQLESGGLIFSGKAPDYPIMQVLELPQAVHPYFIATQAHPELTSRPLRPDPLFLGLVQAALGLSHGVKPTETDVKA
ncbi:MAG: CTP synthase (glutamine hydrolyzing) [Phycisphaerae bacterium]|nr:CTP synthase (glutamine hydrolyzing) [Phycisphaerae bacterium]